MKEYTTMVTKNINYHNIHIKPLKVSTYLSTFCTFTNRDFKNTNNIIFCDTKLTAIPNCIIGIGQ